MNIIGYFRLFGSWTEDDDSVDATSPAVRAMCRFRARVRGRSKITSTLLDDEEDGTAKSGSSLSGRSSQPFKDNSGGFDFFERVESETGSKTIPAELVLGWSSISTGRLSQIRSAYT